MQWSGAVTRKDQTVEWWSAGADTTIKPDPRFPEGRDVDVSFQATLRCTIPLNHPAPGFGAWLVECHRCGARVACSAAGHADDPRSVKIACQGRQTQKKLL